MYAKIKRTSMWASAAVLASALTGTVWAQDGDVPPAGFGEPGTEAPAPPPVPLTPEEEEKRNAEINGNYDATLGVYEGILDRQDTDTSTVNRRIENNEQLIEDYKPKLDDSRQGARSTEVTFRNRILEFKRQRDQGLITEDQFRKLVEQEKAQYEKRKGRYANETEFYGDESKEAKERVKKLQAEKARRERETAMRKASEPKGADPTTAVLENIYSTMDQVSGFRVRFTMDDTAGLWRYDHMHGSAVTE